MVGRPSSPRFIGRLGELGVLDAALARARAGDGSLVLVSGDAGTGKSRLIAEAGLSAASRESPLVLVVEDLHWADRATRDFVLFLAGNLRRERLVVVASYRSDELHRRHPGRRFVRGLERSGKVTRVELRPFSRVELAEQVAAILGAPPGPALIDRLLERTGGNPFFVEELLAASGSADAALPESLRDALVLRVEALPAAAQAVSRVVAVAARVIAEPLLAAVTELPPSELTEALRDAVGHHVLRHEPDFAGYSFRHALLREAVYSDLLAGERHALHVRLAEALAGQPDVTGTLASSAAELAYHWRAARQLGRALPASITAGMEAEAVHASGAALAHYEQALQDWESAGAIDAVLPLSRVEVARRAAEAADLSGEPDRAVVLGRRVLGLLDETGDPVAAALAHERLGRYLWVSGRGRTPCPNTSGQSS